MSADREHWRPGADWPVLALRARLLAAARAWFADRGLTEVDTPILTHRGVTDANIESVRAELAATSGRRWFLHTSPEYAMKRLLAAGAPDIYQICHVFRDGEQGRRHQPEFTMIEWYRHGQDLDAVVADTLSLLATLIGPSRGALRTVTRRHRDVFRETAGVDPVEAGDDAVLAAAAAAGAGDAADDRDAALDFLMGTVVAPALAGPQTLTAVTHYPAAQAALAALDATDPRLALRFEVFLDGRELANGWVELTDAAEQRSRFEADRAARRARGRPDMLPDEALLAALAHGLPETAGVAVGFDRVMMAAAGIDDIRRVQAFPVIDRDRDGGPERDMDQNMDQDMDQDAERES
ncbi:EF-P lysine aminoacylase EpmA [Lentisalinibacter salinarum]|uniref:EF-P lysine aminoacylase EpmA n=1 Tax=Lentisalinibacter salinarum TaxID=2992239 RepID=UPI0038643691